VSGVVQAGVPHPGTFQECPPLVVVAVGGNRPAKECREDPSAFLPERAGADAFLELLSAMGPEQCRQFFRQADDAVAGSRFRGADDAVGLATLRAVARTLAALAVTAVLVDRT